MKDTISVLLRYAAWWVFTSVSEKTLLQSSRYKEAHTRSIMLRKIVLRNTNLPIHDQVNQHHTRSIMLHNTQCCATWLIEYGPLNAYIYTSLHKVTSQKVAIFLTSLTFYHHIIIIRESGWISQCKLRARRPRNWVSNPGIGARVCLFSTASRLTLWPIQWDSAAVSPGAKRLRYEADHSPLLVPTLRMRRAIPPLPHKCSWRDD
jgi:hypothetical protein